MPTFTAILACARSTNLTLRSHSAIASGVAFLCHRKRAPGLQSANPVTCPRLWGCCGGRPSASRRLRVAQPRRASPDRTDFCPCHGMASSIAEHKPAPPSSTSQSKKYSTYSRSQHHPKGCQHSNANSYFLGPRWLSTQANAHSRVIVRQREAGSKFAHPDAPHCGPEVAC